VEEFASEHETHGHTPSLASGLSDHVCMIKALIEPAAAERMTIEHSPLINDFL
jgi:hypothetical protein